MTRKLNDTNVIPLNAPEPSDRWIPIPNRSAGTLRLKGLYRKRGNCYFAAGVPKIIISSAYRAVLRLGMRDRTIIFSRGAVKVRGVSRKDLVSVTELDWDVGTSIIIPHGLSQQTRVILQSPEETREVTMMELIVLGGLLRLPWPEKRASWYFSTAAQVLMYGWKALDTPPAAPVAVIMKRKDTQGS
ncbi:MAG: hypothetical protein JXA20_05465 [Spirochaetes bacterium]|nr:hypothetical protein [Spirochaetota bacterium]